MHVAAPPSQAMCAAAARLLASAQSRGFAGPDPYDGLWWRWPAPLVGGRRRRQVFMQVHARTPVDFRGLYRRSHPFIPKAAGIFASTALGLHRLTGDAQHLDSAVSALKTLEVDRSAGEAAWGYHWDMQTRWSFYPAGSPNVVATTFAALAFHGAAEVTGEQAYARRARQAAEWVRDVLWVDDGNYFSYHPPKTKLIHNASLLAALLVQRVLAGDPTAQDRVRRAVERTISSQRSDGAWPYGDEPNLAFVDGFHTGYVLECLAHLRDVAGVGSESLDRGTRYYVEEFFGAEGQARLWPGKPFPEDAHAAGTGLSSLAVLVREGFADAELIARVAARTLSHVVDGGRTVPRRYRYGKTRVSYLRWCDAHVALGLVNTALLAQDGYLRASAAK